jgi:hypothetical protein
MEVDDDTFMLHAAMRDVYEGGEPPNLPFALVCKMVDNFDPDHKLGSGSFGDTFKVRS